MNDYWNDPPDYPEPPECCDDVMEVLDDGTCKCNKCGKVNRIDCDPEPIFEEADPESYLLDIDELCQTCGKSSPRAIYCCAACSPKCVHGNTPLTNAFIGNQHTVTLTEGEIEMCQFARQLEREIAELADALEDMMAALNFLPCDPSDFCPDAWNAAKSAIAKAKGVQP